MSGLHAEQAETPAHPERRAPATGLLAEAELDQVVGGSAGPGSPGDRNG